MRNQTSFRLTTTVLPTDKGADHKAKVTQVINKVDSSGNKFYPSFSEETVVITNDDRTVMETTRATCTNGVLTFIKRGLSDDASTTEIANRALTWNPGSLCFITAGAGDWIDKDDDIVWTGDQTFTGDMTSTGAATYNGLLTTNKGVKYPSFASVAALEAYSTPFAGMFAVVESSGELYRYNALTEEWSIVTTSTPAYPDQASTEAIGTVRGATDAEFAAGTATGSQGELLIATPAQIKSATPTMGLHVTDLGNDYRAVFTTHTTGDTISVEYTAARDGWIYGYWTMPVRQGKQMVGISTTGSTATVILPRFGLNYASALTTSGAFNISQDFLAPVSAGKVKLTCQMNPDGVSSSLLDEYCEGVLKIAKFFYYG